MMKKLYYKMYGLMCILMFSASAVFAQSGSISGRVTDETQQPVPGASVTIDGTTRGAATDVDGNYTISGISEGSHSVTVQFMGYTSKTIQVMVAGGNTRVDVNLESSSQSLNEVVVIGYGTARKKDLTGSVTTVTSKDFVKGSLTTPEQLINGKVAGVQIVNSGGAPGAGATIRIRGGSSLNASNSPLIVIDGVPIDNDGMAGIGNPLSTLNPNDIESFNVLKDASAAAIYGNRASNGVIIVTTKKGTADAKVKVNFNTLQSVSTKARTIDVLNAEQFKTVFTDYLTRTEGNMDKLKLLGTEDTNWQNEIYHSAFKTDNNLSIAGGVKWLPYRLSLGYLNENGILKTSNFDRLSGALNINPKFFDNHLSVDLNVKGTHGKTRFAGTGAIGNATVFNPTMPVRVPYDSPNSFGGYYEWTTGAVPNTLAAKNPLSMLQQEYNTANVDRSIGNLQLDYKFHFLPELRANLNVGYDVSESDGSLIQLATMGSAFARKGSTAQYSQKKSNKLLDFYLNYTSDIKSIDSRVDVTAGYSYQDWTREQPATTTFFGDRTTAISNPFKTQYTMMSYFGRLNYTFKDKYLLTGTFRTDGSSRFAPGNRWALFPSAAFAWRIKEESFLKESKTFSDLKLRLGYGRTGQQDIGTNDYPYFAKYNQSDVNTKYPIGDIYYYLLRPDAYDENIKWEQTTTYNAAIDFGFFDGRLSGSVDFYLKKTKDLLSIIPPAAGSNLKNILLTNVGDMEGRGVEVNLNAVPIKSKDFNWNVNFNVTHYKVKITNLSATGQNNPIGIASSAVSFIGTSLQYYTAGLAPFSYYVNKQIYDANGKPIEGSYEDTNGDGKVTVATDKYHYKSPNPSYLLGFTSDLNYKKFSLAFTMRANIGAYNYNSIAANIGNGAVLSNIDNYLANASTDILNTGFLKKQEFSDYYIQRASFLRMDNINLGYNFGNITKAVNLAVSANVQNVFVLTPYKGLDPEVFNGIDGNVYARPRIYTIGFNLGF